MDSVQRNRSGSRWMLPAGMTGCATQAVDARPPAVIAVTGIMICVHALQKGCSRASRATYTAIRITQGRSRVKPAPCCSAQRQLAVRTIGGNHQSGIFRVGEAVKREHAALPLFPAMPVHPQLFDEAQFALGGALLNSRIASNSLT